MSLKPLERGNLIFIQCARLTKASKCSPASPPGLAIAMELILQARSTTVCRKNFSCLPSSKKNSPRRPTTKMAIVRTDGLTFPRFRRFRFGAEGKCQLQRFAFAQDSQMHNFAGFEAADHADDIAWAVDVAVVDGKDDVLLLDAAARRRLSW